MGQASAYRRLSSQNTLQGDFGPLEDDQGARLASTFSDVPYGEHGSLDDGPPWQDAESGPLQQRAIAGSGDGKLPVVFFKGAQVGSSDSRCRHALNDGKPCRLVAAIAVEEQPDVDQLPVRVDTELMSATKAPLTTAAGAEPEHADRL
ncbi:MAG TPA: hypothetical protein VKF14_04035 [Candidatus Dormibacteraeota bacterium]|nr:hypothetical protein [Candidatus Dormibacteraeota bacterium]